MTSKTQILLSGCLALGLVQAALAQTTIFYDDFESGNMSKWTATSTTPNPLTISSDQNIVPAGGIWSAYLNTSIDRMHHNIIVDNGGIELSGYSIFHSYWYEAAGTTATRYFNEVRGYSGGTGLPNGGTTANGSLAQLFAIGKYNTVTLAGEVYDGKILETLTNCTRYSRYVPLLSRYPSVPPVV